MKPTKHAEFWPDSRETRQGEISPKRGMGRHFLASTWMTAFGASGRLVPKIRTPAISLKASVNCSLVCSGCCRWLLVGVQVLTGTKPSFGPSDRCEGQRRLYDGYESQDSYDAVGFARANASRSLEVAVQTKATSAFVRISDGSGDGIRRRSCTPPLRLASFDFLGGIRCCQDPGYR